MMLNRIHSRIIHAILLCLGVSLFSACSSNKVNEPTELDRKFKDIISMKRLWKTSVGVGDDDLQLQLSPVLREDYIYSVDVEGQLTVIDRYTGKKEWSIELDEKVSGGLGIDQQHLYYSTFQGELVCLAIDDGSERWRSSLTSEAVAVPATNGQLVVVQTIDGKLTAFDAENGNQKWRYDSVGPILSLRGTASPLISKKYSITSFANGSMLAFDNSNGQPFWKAEIGVPQGRTELERLVDPDGRAVLDGDKIYAVAYQGKLLALNVIDGQEIWSKDLSSFNSVALGFGKLYVTTGTGDIVALDQTNGTEVWRNEQFKYRRLSSPMVFDQTLVTADLDGYVHVLSTTDGEVLARKYPDSDGVMGQMLVSDDLLYVYARSGHIVAYRLFSTETRVESLEYQAVSKPNKASVLDSTTSDNLD
jgi:outer membrane protein assembly factor BamB